MNITASYIKDSALQAKQAVHIDSSGWTC